MLRNTARNRVAFQGELGAFSHAAASKLLFPQAIFVPCESFRAVFQALAQGDVAHAVIPIENTLHGSVHENYDLLLQYDAPIIGETTLRISHSLIGLPGTKLANVRRALSHPVALNQCRIFFDKHPRIQPVAYYDTAGSVKALKENGPDTAAIAGAAAASLYGAVILKPNIEDNRGNFTRFFLVTKQTAPKVKPNQAWKTSIVFSTPNTPGALFRALACFALRDLDMTKIESRPLSKKPWEYIFYVDILGARTDRAVERAFDHLREMATFCKVLGSYQPTP
ncbi:MAG TPA: prephenate dehydratase [Bryobacteraceae bacterium]|jgi:prephenate dehydratase|nr:prephenate dehydratase [Bryobacteraceae bacterium]